MFPQSQVINVHLISSKIYWPRPRYIKCLAAHIIENFKDF